MIPEISAAQRLAGELAQRRCKCTLCVLRRHRAAELRKAGKLKDPPELLGYSYDYIIIDDPLKIEGKIDIIV